MPFFLSPVRPDAASLAGVITEIRNAISNTTRPATFLPSAALGPDYQRLLGTLTKTLEGIRGRNLQRAVGAFAGHPDSTRVESLRKVLEAVGQSLRDRVAEQLGAKKIAALRRLLSLPCADFLTILGRQRDENAHSAVLRWLLDPHTAPTIAPAALAALVQPLEMADEWLIRLRAALATGSISVRREVLLGRESVTAEAADRIDLVVSTPDFILGIENKVGSIEHSSQTQVYWQWLDRQPRTVLRAGLFLTPTGVPASCISFKPISYLELVAVLLEAPAANTLPLEEEWMLASYVKCLDASLLRRQLCTVLEGEDES